MSFLLHLRDFFFPDILTTVASLFFVCLTIYLIKLYRNTFNYPPGPIPLPIIGNILEFRAKDHWIEVIKKCSKMYGPVFTLWMGNKPCVFICDMEMAREAFRKRKFSGRLRTLIGDVMSTPNSRDVIFSDYGKTWEVLRKITHTAVIKYALNDKLAHLATACVDETVQMIITREGVNKEFDPKDYIYLLFLNIMTKSAFGQKYMLEDEEFKKFKYALMNFLCESVGNRIMLWEFSPLFRYLDYKLANKFCYNLGEIKGVVLKYYQDHLKDYDEYIERDFCDALISAKNEALRDGKETAPYLTDENLAACIMDIFVAGTDTTQTSFRWVVLLMAYYQEMQQKLRQEVESEIGDRMPTHEDRNQCHYVMAFISESMRYRGAVPGSVPHKAVESCKVGDHIIPEGTALIVFQDMILNDEKHWPNAHEFRPERFLEEGKYVTIKPKAFIPFSVGRRVCLGENIAIANLFLVLVRLLQKTSDYDIVLEENPNLEPDPYITHELTPHDNKIMLKKK